MIEILKNYLLILATFLLITNASTASGNEFDVNITNEISFIDVKHNGKEVRIQRNQSLDNLINSEYAKTSRKCPTFCIQPHNLGNCIETIGELELLNYLEKSLLPTVAYSSCLILRRLKYWLCIEVKDSNRTVFEKVLHQICAHCKLYKQHFFF